MLLQVLDIAPSDRKALQTLARTTGISMSRLRSLDAHGFEPTADEMKALASYCGVSETAFRLRAGFIDRTLRNALAASAERVADALERGGGERTKGAPANDDAGTPEPDFRTLLGELYRVACIDFLRRLPAASVDLIFCDPPFNLDKLYPSEMDDDLRQGHYLEWCEAWLAECIRLLRDGGSLFVYNL